MSFSLNKSALPLLLLLACKGPQPQESSPLESDPQDSGLAPQGLFGVLEDGQGQRLGATEVLACSLSGCVQGETDAQGRFFFPLEPPAELALKTHEDLTLSPRRAAALEPCRLMQTARFDAGVLLAPSLPEGVPLAGDTVQTLEAGDGLTLSLNPADLSPVFGDRLSDLAAVALEEQHFPAYAPPEGGEVVAVYALHPFGALSSSPIGVQVRSGLPEGTELGVYAVSDLDGSFSEPVMGTVQGGWMRTAEGEGVERLSYLVIVQR